MARFFTKRGLPFLVAVLAVLMGYVPSACAQVKKKTVRVVYLVPKDRVFKAAYQTAIRDAVLELQLWYACNLNGKTFRVNNPVVESKQTPHNAAWYNEHVPADRPAKSLYTWFNALRDASDLLGARTGDPDYVWLIYIDAPGGTGAGAPGVAILPEHDLLGLSGKAGKSTPVSRWIGGSGHELGHALGLQHPGNLHEKAIMQTGYVNYPICYLTRKDEAVLHNHPFLSGQVETHARKRHCFIYDGGYFRWQEGAKYFEIKTGTASVLRFVLRRDDPDFYYVEDPSRGIWVALPKPGKGNQSFWAAGDKDYTPAYQIRD